jgi:hypothetical protein
VDSKKYIRDEITLFARNKYRTLVLYFDYTDVTIEPGGFIGNNPFTAVAHAKRLVELVLEDTVPAQKVRNC